mgnify:CR=1 FL=1
MGRRQFLVLFQHQRQQRLVHANGTVRGVLVLKSTFHGTTPVDAARIVVDEISVVGSRCGRFAPALDLLLAGAVDVESLISEEYRLSEGVSAMKRATERGVLKVLLRP